MPSSLKQLDLTFLDDDDENSIPPVSGLTFKKATPATSSLPAAGSVRKASTAIAPPPKKKAKPAKAFSLIWVCAHGKKKSSRAWQQKALKIVGIYPTKDAAEKAKRDVMSQYECCGHGDIVVGSYWDDEIDLVIREAPLYL